MLNILLLEDDQIEIMKFQRALSKLESDAKVIPTSNGEQALQWLGETPELPDVIFLDLNMPRLNGINHNRCCGGWLGTQLGLMTDVEREIGLERLLKYP